MIGGLHFVLFDETLLLGRVDFVPEFFDESSKEVHVDVLADLVQDKPVADITFGQDCLDGCPSSFVICVANFA